MNTSQDIRWLQRFENMQSAFKKMEHAITAHAADPDNELINMAVIKAFEMTFELSWKTVKDYLEFNGVGVKLPREVIKQAFANDIIADGQVWIDMLDDRNLMAHVYDEARAQQAIASICERYANGIRQVHDYLSARTA